MEKLKNKSGRFYVVISLLAVLGVAAGIRAYSLSQNVNVEGDYNYYEAQGQPSDGQTGELNLGASPGDYFLVNSLEYGTDLSARLKFSAAATTTPGGLFKILNVGTRKICDLVQVDVNTA